MYLDPNIDRVLRASMRAEGWKNGDARLINQASDRGGLTRGGVTAQNWGWYRKLGRPATAAELQAMTEDEALEFYYEWYVVLPHFDLVTDQRLRALLIDWSFTSWYDDPIKALQESLKTRGLYAGAIDGHLGPKTKAALFADRDPRQTYRDVFVARVAFYRTLALGDPLLWRLLKKADPDGLEVAKLQIHNLAGWQNRTLEFTP